MTPTDVIVTEGEKSDHLPEGATITAPPSREAVRERIAAVVRRSDDLIDDLVIAVQVQERLAHDDGERISLENFIVQQGFEPSDFDS